MVCRNSDELGRHNSILRGLEAVTRQGYQAEETREPQETHNEDRPYRRNRGRKTVQLKRARAEQRVAHATGNCAHISKAKLHLSPSKKVYSARLRDAYGSVNHRRRRGDGRNGAGIPNEGQTAQTALNLDTVDATVNLIIVGPGDKRESVRINKDAPVRELF